MEVALARAFRDDPMSTWLLGDRGSPARDAAAAIGGFFGPGVTAGLRRGHSYVVPSAGGGLAAVAVWSPPDVGMFTEAEGGELAARLVEHAAPGGLDRLMALAEMTRELHPGGTHFYLFLLGAPEQGHGHGATVLQPVLDRCDADGLPAYLESSSARNVPFYERNGFRVLWERAPDGGPTLRGMWREPTRRDG